MSGTPTARYVWLSDLVWHVARDPVLVRRVGDHDPAAATDLLGATALVWVGAEHPLTRAEIAADTSLDADEGTPAIAEVRPALALAELVEHTVVPNDARVAEVFGRLDALGRRIPIVRLGYDTPADGVALLGEPAERRPP